MLLGITFVASGLLWSTISAIPAQTSYSNSAILKASVTSPASSNASSCPVSCMYLPILRTSQYWSKYVSVATVATVVIVVNDSNNTTKTVTNYVESLLVNGTAPTNSLPPRTDTNEAGTVTQQIPVLGNSKATFTYPTPYYEVDSEYMFSGILPYSKDGGITCTSDDGPSMPLPPHTPWPSPTGTVDPEDRFGLSYTMQDEYDLPGYSKDWVATQFPGELIDAVFQSCTTPKVPKPATAVSAVSFLTVTSTAHVSDPVTAEPSPSPPDVQGEGMPPKPPVPEKEETPPKPPVPAEKEETPPKPPVPAEKEETPPKPPVPAEKEETPPKPPVPAEKEETPSNPPVPANLDADPPQPPNPSPSLAEVDQVPAAVPASAFTQDPPLAPTPTTDIAPVTNSPPDDALPLPPDIPGFEPQVPSPSVPRNSTSITPSSSLPVFTGAAQSLRHVGFKALQYGIAVWCIYAIHIV